eukprot:scaffold11736_cov159-Ochromonas_danica.AAC.12
MLRDRPAAKPRIPRAVMERAAKVASHVALRCGVEYVADLLLLLCRSPNTFHWVRATASHSILLAPEEDCHQMRKAKKRGGGLLLTIVQDFLPSQRAIAVRPERVWLDEVSALVAGTGVDMELRAWQDDNVFGEDEAMQFLGVAEEVSCQGDLSAGGIVDGQVLVLGIQRGDEGSLAERELRTDEVVQEVHLQIPLVLLHRLQCLSIFFAVISLREDESRQRVGAK